MPDSGSNPSRRLAELLTREIAALDALHAELKAEAGQINPAGYASLEETAARKQGLIETLQTLQEQQARLLADAGQPADKEGIGRLIAALPGADRGTLSAQWQRLRALLRACRDQNLVNGSIIGMNLRHCQQSMAVLCGQPAGESLYDPSGNTTAAVPRRRSLKA